MWLSVGSSSSFIDVMGHVGMFGVSDHITSLSSRSLLCIWNPNLSGPKSRWVGADFGPKPLKRPGPGNPVPASVGRRVASQESSDCGRPSAALHRRLPQRLEFPPDHEQGRCIEDRAV